MIPKFVIPLLYVCVLVCTDDQEVETNAIKKKSPGNIATILQPEFIKNNKSELRDEKVKIQLYYESLCPYCQAFGSKSFKITVLQLRSYLDVHMYPFGNARVQENGSIVCQHGPRECYGNKLHACAIDYIDDIILAVVFNGCMMDDSNGDWGSDDAAADKCASVMKLDSEPIKQCAKGPKGEELLKFYGDESKKVHYDGVPTVLINGVPGDTDNFKSNVCKSFKNPPKPCIR